MRSDIKLTPSRVRDYLSCPLKFARLYGPAQEYQSNSNAALEQTDAARRSRATALALGTCVHSAPGSP